MRILLSGHNTCLNRGCEAIVRTTAAALARLAPTATLHLPTETPAYDAAVLADAALPVTTEARTRPRVERWLKAAQRRQVPLAQLNAWPLPAPPVWRRQLAGVDLVLAVGGDTYSLDYSLPVNVVGGDLVAARLGKPVILWGASVGPFTARPRYARAVTQALARHRAVTVRESATHAALADDGKLGNVYAMRDPAFDLAAEPLPPAEAARLAAVTDGAALVTGLNLSPIAARDAGDPGRFRAEAAALLHALATEPGAAVLLIPHVAHPPHRAKPADADLLAEILADAALPPAARARVQLLPGHWRAGQYKTAIGACHRLLAARTHATIAGYSQDIPTIALGAGRKATALAADIYGAAAPERHLAPDAFTARAALTALAAARRHAATWAAASRTYRSAGPPGPEAVLARLAGRAGLPP